MNDVEVRIKASHDSDGWDFSCTTEIDGQLFRESYFNEDLGLPFAYVVGLALGQFAKYIQGYTAPSCSECRRPL